MSESPLSTHAGPIAVIAGGLFAVAHLGQFVVMDRSNLLTMVLDPAFRLSVRSRRILYYGHRHCRLGWRHVV